MGVSESLLDLSHFIDVLPTGLMFSISGTVFLTVGKMPVIPDTNPLLIFSMLLLYFNSVMGLAFALSYVSDSGKCFAYLYKLTKLKLLKEKAYFHVLHPFFTKLASRPTFL